MPTIGKPKPRFLKYVDKPDNVGAVELSQAQPVFIDGLPTGGGEATPTAWADVTGKPAVIAAGADQAAARTAIGAGTSSIAVGTGAAQAAAGNHNHAIAADAGSGLAAAANLQAAFVALSARVKALEDATG